jgi:hypothetical protein
MTEQVETGIISKILAIGMVVVMIGMFWGGLAGFYPVHSIQAIKHPQVAYIELWYVNAPFGFLYGAPEGSLWQFNTVMQEGYNLKFFNEAHELQSLNLNSETTNIVVDGTFRLEIDYVTYTYQTYWFGMKSGSEVNELPKDTSPLSIAFSGINLPFTYDFNTYKIHLPSLPENFTSNGEIR